MNALYELTVRIFDQIDADYWRKCVLHVLRKEIPYYIAHDASPGHQDKLVVFSPSRWLTIEDVFHNDETIIEPSSPKSICDTNLPSTSTWRANTFTDLDQDAIIAECADNKISPVKVAEQFETSPYIVRNLLKRSGKDLPEKYLEKMDNRPVKRRRLETENHHSDSIQINENPTPSTVDKKGKGKGKGKGKSSQIVKSTAPAALENLDSLSIAPNSLMQNEIALELKPSPTMGTVLDWKDPSIQPPVKNQKPMFSCPKTDCTYETNQSNHLKSHIKNHFDCTQCEKTFQGKNANRSLIRHLKSHGIIDQSKLFQCELCKKTFSTKYTKEQHQEFNCPGFPMP